MAMPSVRTRFAPSPTGYLHIGGVRTALFNYLFARHEGGQFILRIEDTDRERSTPEATAVILDGLSWLGLDWDEGPFYQSERSGLYREHVERLLAAGHAYRCYCSPAELEAKRAAALSAGQKPMYDRTCRSRTDHPEGTAFVVRFKAPIVGETVVPDLVKGPVVFQNQELDDLIIVRSDGTPTYNFCAVVDDALMRITHIIRGEDHLTNTPKQIQLYRAFGFPEPAFTHVPLIHGLSGGRLSKRHGATSVTAYRDAGYLPDALVNYLVRLGWSYGDQEIFTRRELVEKFSLDRVGTAAAVFDPEKLDWVNFQYLKVLPPRELALAIKPFIAARGWTIPGDEVWLEKLVVTLQTRAKTLDELAASAHFYLCDDIQIDPAATTHLAKTDPAVWMELRQGLAGIPEWSAAAIHAVFDTVIARHHLKLGQLAQPVRVALTGGTTSPGIFEVAEVVGKERVLARLDRAASRVGQAAQAPTGT